MPTQLGLTYSSGGTQIGFGYGNVSWLFASDKKTKDSLVGMFCHRHGFRCLCDSEERIRLSKAARLDEIQALNGRLRRLPLVDFGQEWSSTSRRTSGGFRPEAVVRLFAMHLKTL